MTTDPNKVHDLQTGLGRAQVYSEAGRRSRVALPACYGSRHGYQLTYRRA